MTRYGPYRRGFNVARGAVFRTGHILVFAIGVWLSGSVLANAAERPVIVAFGDSLTAGYGVSQTASFPAKLSRALAGEGIESRMINAGVSGDTSAGALARLDWMLGDDPDLVIVEFGANDGLRGLEPDNTFANLDAILTRLKARGVTVLLTGMEAPPNLGAEYGRAFGAVFPRLAKKHGVVFYPFFLDGVVAAPELNQFDGIHPNEYGVDVIVAGILPYVLRALERADVK